MSIGTICSLFWSSRYSEALAGSGWPVLRDRILVMAHGATDEIARAKAILATANPSRLDVHAGVKSAQSADGLVPTAG
jgi:hypothetical protein